MSLQKTINEDLKQSIKSKDEKKLSTLRMIKSDIQYELTKTGDSDLSDEKVIAILKKNAKSRHETAEEYKKADRLDLAQKELEEEQIILQYLPKGPSSTEIEAFVRSLVAETPPKSLSDVGRYTGKVMQNFKGQNVDGSEISNLVKSVIQEKL
jgi:uncharacterized protein